jgi:tRNA nucleotidyltransferase (CCA-adding enzyme)
LDVEKRPPDPLLLGRHLIELGMQPGPRMGEITRAVYELQLDGRVRTLEQAIAEAKQLLAQESA